MKKILLLLTLTLIANMAFGGGVVPKGTTGETLPAINKLVFGPQQKAGLYVGNVDPTVSPVSANQGAIYQSELTGKIYVKTDAGSSVNWVDIKGEIDAIVASKGQPNGIAPLNGSGVIDTSYLPSSILASLKFKGVWDSATNTPSLSSGIGTSGDIYVVSVSGATTLDGYTDWTVGDWAVFNGEQGRWEKVDNTDLVTSVQGKSGAVVLDHNELNNPQGGIAGQYYHIDAEQDTNLADIASTGDGALLLGATADNAKAKVRKNWNGIGADTLWLQARENTADGANMFLKGKDSSSNPSSIGFTSGANNLMTMASDGSLIAGTAGYESLVIGDNTLTNKKYVDDSISSGVLPIQSYMGTRPLTGGVISCNTEGGTSVDITALEGVHVDNWSNPIGPVVTPISYAGATNIALTNIATAPITWLYINELGNVVQEVTAPTASDWRDKIFLGSVLHPAGVCNALNVSNGGTQIGFNVAGAFADLSYTLGPLNSSGNVVSPNGANLSFDKSAGSILVFGSNQKTDIKNGNFEPQGACTACPFTYTYKDGAGGFTLAPATAIDVANYDDGTGTLEAVNNGWWAFHRVYIVPQGIAVQYGQTTYKTRADAVIGFPSEVFDKNPSLNGALYLGAWLVSENDTELSATNWFPASSASGGGSSSITYNTWGTNNVDFLASPISVDSCDRVYYINASAGAVTLRLPDVPAGTVDCRNKFILAENSNTATVTSDSGTILIGGVTSQVIRNAKEGFEVMYNAGTSSYMIIQDNRGLSSISVDADKNITTANQLRSVGIYGANTDPDKFAVQDGLNYNATDSSFVGGASATSSEVAFNLRLATMTMSATNTDSLMMFDAVTDPQIYKDAWYAVHVNYGISGTESEVVQCAVYDNGVKIAGQYEPKLSGTDNQTKRAKIQFQMPTSPTKIQVGCEQIALSVGPQSFSITQLVWDKDPDSQVAFENSSGWSEPEAITIGASVTPPSKGTIIQDQIRWRRDGSDAIIDMRYAQSSAGSAGSGYYTFQLPAGLEADTDLIPIGSNGTREILMGSSGAQAVGTITQGNVALISSTEFGIIVLNDTLGPNYIGSAFSSMSNTPVNYTATFRVPIKGWTASGSGIVGEGETPLSAFEWPQYDISSHVSGITVTSATARPIKTPEGNIEMFVSIIGTQASSTTGAATISGITNALDQTGTQAGDSFGRAYLSTGGVLIQETSAATTAFNSSGIFKLSAWPTWATKGDTIGGPTTVLAKSAVKDNNSVDFTTLAGRDGSGNLLFGSWDATGNALEVSSDANNTRITVVNKPESGVITLQAYNSGSQIDTAIRRYNSSGVLQDIANNGATANAWAQVQYDLAQAKVSVGDYFLLNTSVAVSGWRADASAFALETGFISLAASTLDYKTAETKLPYKWDGCNLYQKAFDLTTVASGSLIDGSITTATIKPRKGWVKNTADSRWYKSIYTTNAYMVLRSDGLIYESQNNFDDFSVEIQYTKNSECSN